MVKETREDSGTEPIRLLRIDPSGGTREVLAESPAPSGNFLHYKYANFDFSKIHEPGMALPLAGKTN